MLPSYKKLFSLFLFLILIQVNCAHTPQTLKDWVKERGYTYYTDYSTINILGYEDQKGKLQSNPYLSVSSEKGNVPDVSQEKKHIFKIEGKAEIERFLNTATEGNITGKFERSAEAEIKLEMPFKKEASAFIPLGPCDNRVISIVTKVLNTGSMKLRIKDKSGIDITSTFKPILAKTESGVLIESGDEITISGNNFYVGYQTELKHCYLVKEKEIILKLREQYHDSELGIYALLSDYREENFRGEALVYIIPSNFTDSKAIGENINWTPFGEINVKAGNPWEDAINLSDKKGNEEPWRFTTSNGFKLKFGDHLGLPGISGISGFYIEVVSLNKEEVKLKVQHIKYEVVEKKEK
ncbi:MAG: hypothetical protein PHX78_03185 [bacterium]|nr:hypothetical protein [bacterium]